MCSSLYKQILSKNHKQIIRFHWIENCQELLKDNKKTITKTGENISNKSLHKVCLESKYRDAVIGTPYMCYFPWFVGFFKPNSDCDKT